jgi:4-amino-4-deoxy-L-arabinose transferase-like glycosyltransferase
VDHPVDHTGAASATRLYGARVTSHSFAERRFWPALAALTLLGLAIRLVYALAVAPDEIQPGDGFIYHVLAGQIAGGHGYRLAGIVDSPYPTASHPPLYPLYLAVATKLGFDGMLAQRAISCLLGAVAVGGVGVLGRQLAGARAGLLAAGLAAVYAQLFVVDGTLIAESLYAPLIVLTLIVAYRFLERPTGWDAAALGALIGLATLTRSEGILLLPVLAAPLAWRAAGGRMRAITIMVAAAALVVSPWLIRNWVQFDRFPLFATNGALTQGATACPTAFSGPRIGFVAHNCGLNSPCLKERSELAQSDCFGRRARAYVRDNLDRLPLVLAARVGRLWNVYKPGADLSYGQLWARERKIATVGLATYALFVAAGLFGAVQLRRRGVTLLPLLATLVAATLTSMIAFGFSRYRLVAEPAIVVLAAVGLEAAAVSTASRLRRATPAAERASAAAPPAAP